MSIRTPHPDQSTKKRVSKSLELTRRFMHRGFENPEIFESIPDAVVLILIPDNDPDQAAAEIEFGIRAVESGENVFFRHMSAEEFPEQ
jgi:hypothetical protein